jgi:predicted N-acetyltransferase YhbS
VAPLVRFLRPGDEPALVEHLLATFGSWPQVDISGPALEHLRWKLGREPEASSCSVIAEEESRIVGALLFAGQRIRTRGGDLLAAHGVDWSVRPEYQEQGLMVEMRLFAAERLDKQADFNPGQTAHGRIRRLHERLGYKLIANALHRFVVDLANGGPPTSRRVAIRDVDAFDERFDSLWEEAAPSFDYVGVRDRAALTRRYCDERAGAFTIKVAEDEGELLGYCVSRTSNARRSGYIADLFALPDRADAIEALVADALTTFRQEGLSTGECRLPEHHPYRPVIEAAGFVARSRPVDEIYMALRVSEEALAFLLDPSAALHITMGDSDIV